MAMMAPSTYRMGVTGPLAQRTSSSKLRQHKGGQKLLTFKISNKIMGSPNGIVMLALTEVSPHIEGFILGLRANVF